MLACPRKWEAFKTVFLPRRSVQKQNEVDSRKNRLLGLEFFGAPSFALPIAQVIGRSDET